jgi:uncharacterized RDD family membrane protein YckC
MTAPSAHLDYASVPTGLCPICNERQVSHKTLYGYPICKKCLYRFANRRQIAYLIDSILFTVPLVGVSFLLEPMLAAVSITDFQSEIVTTVIALGFNTLFNMKDGFNGQSPGKRLTGVQVIDETTGRPISFVQSFKRNWMFLLGVLPFAGPWISLAIVITIIIQMTKGYRLGDRLAGTRVIWKKYADSPVFGGKGMLCRSCRYDLTGNQSGLCPECGTPVATPVATRVHVAGPAAVA